MGVCITLCVILSLTLYVGWRWYFDSIANRNTLLELAQKAEKRVQDLENLGISFEAATTDAPPVAPLPKLLAGSDEPAKTDPLTPTSPAQSASQQDSAYPPESSIKTLPLLESSEEVAQALAVLDQYWKTESWQGRLPLVAHSERVTALMKDYYETQGAKDPVPGDLISKARFEIDGTEILYFSYKCSRPTDSLEIAMLRGPQGKFVIDWESLTGYGEISFQEFRSKRPAKSVLMRAYVRLYEYYNFEFSDSKKYLCVKLMSENGDNSVYGYCERGSKLAHWLETDLADTGPSKFRGYTLLLSFPPNAQSNQCVNLDKVVSARWLQVP